MAFLKKLFFGVALLAGCVSFSHAEKVRLIPQADPSLDFITVLDTTSIRAGSGITVATTSAGVAITASGGASGTFWCQEGDSNVDVAVSTLDFHAPDFDLTSSPSGEANIFLSSNVARSSVTVTAGSGLSGGGTLAADRTISLTDPISASFLDNAILLQGTLQTGATFYVSSGTVNSLNVTTIRFPDGTVQVTSPTAGSGDITDVLAGYGLLGGGTSGSVTLNLDANTTSYIHNTATLQTGATFYVSSGTVNHLIVSTAIVSQFIELREFSNPSIPSDGFRLHAVDVNGVTVLEGLDSEGKDHHLMREQYIVVRNVTGVQIDAGKAVYISGSTGQIPQVSLAKADSTATLPAIGIVEEDIAHNAYGLVTTDGLIDDLNTSSFSEGDELYVSSSVAGQLTTTVSTEYNQPIAVVMTDHAIQGKLLIHVNDVVSKDQVILNRATLQTGATFYISSGTINNQLTINGLSASQMVRTNANKTLISSNSVNASTEFSGTLQAAQFPALTGDVTTTAGSLVTTVADNSVDGTDIALGSDAQGDVMYYNGSDWARLGAGVRGKYLATQGAGANPTWAVSCTTGTSFPASPLQGECFIHTPTGRAIEYRYDGSSWYATAGYGSITLYVDPLRGSDSIVKGTGTFGGAFQTPAYAYSILPPMNNGNTTINLGTGTYTGADTLRGKTFSGNYSITIQGTKTTIQTGTAAAGANGSGVGTGGYGTMRIAGALTANAHKFQFLSITGGTGAGQIFPIYENNTATFTVVGLWTTPPDGTSTYEVYTVTNTILSGVSETQIPLTIAGGQKGVFVADLTIADAVYGLLVSDADVQIYYVYFTTVTFYGIDMRLASKSAAFASSIFRNCGIAVNMDSYSGASMSNLYISTGPAGSIGIYQQGSLTSTIVQTAIEGQDQAGIWITNNANMVIQDYNDIARSTGDNITITNGAVMQNSNGVLGSTRLRNAGDWGLQAASGGVCAGCSGFTYSGNTSGTFDPATMIAGGVD